MKSLVGIVIRTTRYRENSAIIKVFSVDGVLSILVNHLKKNIPFLNCLNILDIDIYSSQTEIFRLKNTNFHIKGYSSPKIQPLRLFVSEVLYQILNKETINKDLFKFLYQKISSINENTDIKIFTLNFLIKTTFFLGIFPENNLSKDYFDLKESIFCDNIPSHNLYIPKMYIDKWRNILSSKLETISNDNFKIYMKIILKYYQIHIENFNIPSSFQLLKNII